MEAGAAARPPPGGLPHAAQVHAVRGQSSSNSKLLLFLLSWVVVVVADGPSARVLQWQDPRQAPALWYVVYRWLSAGMFLAVAVCSVMDAGRDGQDLGDRYIKWPIYLTNWGLACCCVQAALGAGLSTAALVQDRRQRRGEHYQPPRNKLPDSNGSDHGCSISHTVLLCIHGLHLFGRVRGPQPKRIAR